jgi:hypothetical protein
MTSRQTVHTLLNVGGHGGEVLALRHGDELHAQPYRTVWVRREFEDRQSPVVARDEGPFAAAECSKSELVGPVSMHNLRSLPPQCLGQEASLDLKGVTGAVAWPIGAVTDAQPRTVQHGFLPLGNCRIAARHNDLVPATQELMDESVHGRTAQSPWSARRHIGQMNEQLLGGHRATDPDPHRHDAPCGPRADGLRPASAMTAVMVPAPSRWRALSFRSPARA